MRAVEVSKVSVTILLRETVDQKVASIELLSVLIEGAH